MTSRKKLFAGVFAGALALTLTTAIVLGQQKQSPPDRDVIIERSIQGPEGPPPDHTFTFVSSEMNIDGKLVKGVPYSAKAVTETAQVLGDGNRIINKSSASVYRDSEGRMRREQSLQAIGPFATAGEPPQTIFINDPVAGVNYALDPRARVAHKMLPMKFDFKYAPRHGDQGVAPAPHEAPAPPAPPEGSEKQTRVFLRTAAPPPPGAAGMVMEWKGGHERKGKKESLGKQTIEGVEAEGTRTTITIPSGEIGNERAIEIISERWYSPVLQAVVMTRHSDPRFGETTYRLTNIDRSEPARSLFEVPADYKVEDASMLRRKIRMMKPAPGTE